MNIREELGARIEAALRAVTGTALPAVVQPATRPEFGDYQANGVMAAAKRLGRNPRELAAEVVAAAELDDLTDSVTVAGPGFLNIVLGSAYLGQRISDAPLVDPVAAPGTVVVDYSSPNLAKEMHVGHLRSTIIGDAVARVLAALGHRVIRQNHVGDWGTQFGMLLSHLADLGDQHAASELADLEVFYRDAKKRFDEDPAFAERSRRAVVQLQAGDARARTHWARFIEVSLAHCHAIYQRLGVSLGPRDVKPESAYNEALPGIVDTLEAHGLITESEGARCVFLDEFRGKDGNPLPVIVQKSDGGYLYATTDLAAVRHRVTELGASRVLYFTDARQALHFRQIFAVARAAGLAPDSVLLEHHPFGSMLGKDGKPFQTRQGSVVRLTDLLDEAEQRAYDLVTAKNADLPEEERRSLARVIGVGAVKYADLSKNRTSDYVFDWDQMLSFDGNTAPYLLYAYTRIRSVFRRGGVDPEGLDGVPALTTDAEHALAVAGLRLQEVLEQVAEDAFPHVLCGFLYDLATAFTRFYEACPILNADPEVRVSRLLLCRHTAATLAFGLDLLGIETVEQM